MIEFRFLINQVRQFSACSQVVLSPIQRSDYVVGRFVRQAVTEDNETR